MSDAADNDNKQNSRIPLSRRDFLASAGIAAVSATPALAVTAAQAASHAHKTAAGDIPQAPFESFREFVEAVEASGLLWRIPRLDQDQFEITALMYRLVDEYGFTEAPAILVEEVKIDGHWFKGPFIVNHMGHYNNEALMFGVEPVPNDSRATYRKVMAHLDSRLVDGQYPPIAPVEVSRDEAPCKEITLEGDDIDLTRFPFVHCNPGDAGRYITTGSVFTRDPEAGVNFGTYRCQLKGPRLIGINSEAIQTGAKQLRAAKERGDEFAKVSVVLGQPPVVWITSSSAIARRWSGRPIDELAVAGGLNGAAIKVVKCDTNDFLVPANAEMIIEGEIPLQMKGLPEAPFAEMYKHMGPRKAENLYMNVTRVTHRKDPWFLGHFTGVNKANCTAPSSALSNNGFRRLIPGFVQLNAPYEVMGVTYVSIDKTEPGQGLKIGKQLAKLVPIYKVIIVVDKDVDVLDHMQVGSALGSRLQPATAIAVVEDAPAIPLEPTLMTDNFRTNKLIIDATKQWPEEGGPEVFARWSRDVFEELAPDSMANVDAKLGARFKPRDRNWGKV